MEPSDTLSPCPCPGADPLEPLGAGGPQDASKGDRMHVKGISTCAS